MNVVTAREMQRIEEKAVETGLSIGTLMERAGKTVADEVLKMIPLNATAGSVVIISGKGNNGGDGFVAARHLAGRSLKITVFLLASPKQLKGEALEAFERLKSTSVKKVTLTSRSVAQLDKALGKNPVVVDAIFGFGFRGTVRDPVSAVIKRLNAYGGQKLSVDVPSGIDATSGTVGGLAVQATRTITFSCPKLGLVIHPGRSYVGQLVVADIGIPQQLVEKASITRINDKQKLSAMLPWRAPDTHKKAVGQVLVLAGSRGMTGAAALAAEAALRSGAGLVVLGVPAGLNSILEQKLTEVITIPLPETAEHSLSERAYSAIMERVPAFDALIVGPGLSRSPETAALVRKVVRSALCPLVLDADGLTAFTDKTAILKERNASTIITPHEGELARLLGTDSAKIRANRVNAALETAKELDVVTVLKGAGTVIASNSEIVINQSGNAGLASAGTGDVLAGLIGGFLAQGLSPFNAAALGAHLHGSAADFAVRELTEYCLIAGDILKYLPQAIKELGSQAS